MKKFGRNPTKNVHQFSSDYPFAGFIFYVCHGSIMRFAMGCRIYESFIGIENEMIEHDFFEEYMFITRELKIKTKRTVVFRKKKY